MPKASIREHRRWAGLTQVELAQRIGVSRITVGHWETGRRRPTPRHLVALAKALGVKPQEIALAP